ncbi:MAG: isoprenylcysteine carboxylmethyltransferase family protein [Deltaproteobacteria bacterium]|nr:isoprenylcysteine carboxylmethyltransferase family protein [Deltaproteobacteria bacterium]MBW2394619.1 isoprenylcysteine carboxylmethyltransferase family protein [Deltaproteobacteria bacterium]
MMKGAELRAILALPFNVLVTIPALLLWWSGDAAWPAVGLVQSCVAIACFGIGLTLMTTTIRLFSREGHGTLAPWAPTETLVIRGPYRFVRNPMISGVLFNLLGEALMMGSWTLGIWFVGFSLGNAIYLPLFEEEGLAERFGPAYERYRQAVPRWLPRIRPYDPTLEPSDRARPPRV